MRTEALRRTSAFHQASGDGGAVLAGFCRFLNRENRRANGHRDRRCGWGGLPRQGAVRTRRLGNRCSIH